MHDNGLARKVIARRLQRTAGAIASRLKKISERKGRQTTAKSQSKRKAQKAERRKSDWRAIEATAKKHRIKALYHFTDRANIGSIVSKGGLYGWETLRRKNIYVPRPGGNAVSRKLDREKKLQDYVRLSFSTDLPMLYVAKQDGRIKNPVWLKIDLDVLFWEDTLFSDRNATDKNAQIGGRASDFQRIRFDVLKTDSWTGKQQKAYKQAEVLVRSHIDLKYILSL
jgi:hypothetical protein